MVDYHKYIQSDAWKAKRDAALERAGFKCQVCAATRNIEVHHNTYERLGDELPTDLVALCKACHLVHHTRRDERTARKISLRPKWSQPPALPRRQFTDAEKAAIRAEYNPRFGYRPLMKTYGCSRGDIRRILHGRRSDRKESRRLRTPFEMEMDAAWNARLRED